MSGEAVAAAAPGTETENAAARSRARLVRGLVWLLCAGLVVHSIGAHVGAWAGGRLGLFSTLLVGALWPAWLVVFLPGWLAWRVLRPLRFRRGVRVCLWLSPIASLRDLPSIEAFLEVLAGRPLPRSSGRTADAWLAFAAALQAEQQGDRPRAERILDVLTHQPAGCRVPLLARVYAVEALAWVAYQRGDWSRVLRYTRLGDGRLVRLLALLTLAELGEPVRRSWLAAAWTLSPKRRETLTHLRQAMARASARARSIPPPAALRGILPEIPSVTDPRLCHVLLLGRAERGEPFHLREVLALAETWQTQLDDAAMAQLQARALELDARHGAQRAAAMRETVLDELALLAAAAQGEIPAHPVAELRPASGAPEGLALSAEVAARLRKQLCTDVTQALDGLATGSNDALDAWERWLVLRSAFDRLLSRAGEPTAAALWHSDVRNRAWAFACGLFDRRQEETAWAAHMVFAWLAERAECWNDMQAMLLNRENARIAQRASL